MYACLNLNMFAACCIPESQPFMVRSICMRQACRPSHERKHADANLRVHEQEPCVSMHDK